MIGKELLTPSRSYFIARCGGFINIVRLAGLPMPPRSQRDVDGERRQRAYHETKARRKAPRSRNDDGSRITNDQITDVFKIILAEKGYLSRPLIDADPRVPMSHTVAVRLDGMLKDRKSTGLNSSH